MLSTGQPERVGRKNSIEPSDPADSQSSRLERGGPDRLHAADQRAGEAVREPVPDRADVHAIGKAGDDHAAGDQRRGRQPVAGSVPRGGLVSACRGAVVWEHPIRPAYNDAGAPMTYQWKGRQYIVIPTGGGAATAHLVAFALKREGDTQVAVAVFAISLIRPALD